jgi:hopene-associated glycosyltransferase HpnB
MYLIGLIVGVACLAIWSYLLLLRGGFWKVWRLQSPKLPLGMVVGQIAVVIPARDEADVIGASVGSLLEQNLIESMHIFVVDDHSSDGTAQAARQAAHNCGRSDGLTVLTGTGLPAEWTGKLWAVQQGIHEAQKLNPQFLLLTDADIIHSPDNVATLVGIAQAGNYDLASFMVKLHCRSLAERLLIPPFVFFFFLLYPPDWIRDPRRNTAGAAGGCMLVRPEALERPGGLASIRGEIIDDCALAKAVKRSGGKVWLGLTPNTRSERAYGSFAEIDHMIARTAFNQLRHSALLLIGAIIGMFLSYLLPLVLIFSGDRIIAALGVLAWFLMALAYLPVVRFYELNPLWSLTLPLSACFYMVATIHSAFKFWAGRGGEWKGRVQDTATDLGTPSSRQTRTPTD